jgi:hypothetical protein
MRVAIPIVSVAVLCACVRLFLGPLTPEAPRPPLPAAGPSREMLVDLRREVDTVEQRYQDIGCELCEEIDEFEFIERLAYDLRARKLRSARLGPRRWGGPAWSFDVSVETDWRGLLDLLDRSARFEPRRWGGPAWSFDVSVQTDWRGLLDLLDSYQYEFKKLVLVKDLRILRVADDHLSASFVLIVIARPTQFATAVVHRGD